jgi:hypothetical protein
MKYGDLSNEVVPRLVLVFEGALGAISPEDRRDFDKAIKREHWSAAADLWTLNELMCQQLWYATRYLHQEIDVVTFVGGEEYGEALAYRLQDLEDLPVNHVYYIEPRILKRKVNYDAGIARVYDPDGPRSSTWGNKGEHIKSVNQLGN